MDTPPPPVEATWKINEGGRFAGRPADVTVTYREGAVDIACGHDSVTLLADSDGKTAGAAIVAALRFGPAT